jgi:hypothetical protein
MVIHLAADYVAVTKQPDDPDNGSRIVFVWRGLFFAKPRGLWRCLIGWLALRLLQIANPRPSIDLKISRRLCVGGEIFESSHPVPLTQGEPLSVACAVKLMCSRFQALEYWKELECRN